MGEHVIKLPDVGEGVAEAELVEWLVDIGANVKEDEALASVMTDKATVEIPAPVDGKVVWRGGDVGDVIAVGSELIKLEVDGPGNVKQGDKKTAERAQETPPATAAKASQVKTQATATFDKTNGAGAAAVSAAADAAQMTPKSSHAAGAAQRFGGAPRPEGEDVQASPAVRKRAMEAGVDIRRVRGSGPAGRITHDDLATFMSDGGALDGSAPALSADTSVNEIPVIGMRRKIAEKMTIAASRIPHITYVDEVDMTALEEQRAKLNDLRKDGRPKLTILPFLMRAMVKAIGEHPHLNSIFDDEAGVIRQFGGCHIGIATQTPNGLMVPVVRHAEARDIWDCAAEVARISEAARTGAAKREELSGSTITITSLGAIGGVATTPVINHPEVAIIGVNKMQVLPKWDGAEFRPRKVMNLSSSFDHRIIDGWDAAVFIQRIKTLLENPLLIFVQE